MLEPLDISLVSGICFGSVRSKPAIWFLSYGFLFDTLIVQLFISRD
jgi:hypothetical protein